MKPLTTFDNFAALDIRVGKVLEVADSPARKPSYKLTIDFGPEVGIKTSSAAVREMYSADELLGRQVVAIVNLPPRRVATVDSEVLCLGAVDADGRVRLLMPDTPAEIGDAIA